MIYNSKVMEEKALMDVAQHMCAAARTAPKTRGIDKLETVVITGEDLLVLADKMEEIDVRKNGENRTFFTRDAGNVRNSGAVVLIGIKKHYYGLDCADCGFATCKECLEHGGCCVFTGIDLGIAVSSAATIASSFHVDNRVMYSVGTSARELEGIDGDMIWLGIPLGVSGKSPYFDRIKK